jgi:tetratricopeptide (TPR) repeat protein
MRIALALFLLGALCLPARADNTTEARAHFESGNAAYALGDYPAAAKEYEKAFSLRPDPALLYNAAQAHRMANNKQRALLLYQNYLRVYGRQINNRDEVQRHISNLKHAIESEEQSQTSPPTTPVSPGTTSAPPPPGTTGTPPPSGETAAPALPERGAANPAVAPAPVRTDDRPLTKKPWFWVAVGGAAVVVAGVAIGLGVGLSGGDKDPKPSLGAGAGN